MAIPDSLKARMDLFAATGRVFTREEDLFKEMSWLQVLIGQGVMPRTTHPMTSVVSDDQAAGYLANIRQIMARTAAALPSHEAFIARHCAMDA
jgi:tryptophan halogenase